MRVYVCVRACVSLLFARTHTRTYTHTRTQTGTNTDTHSHTHRHAHTHTRTGAPEQYKHHSSYTRVTDRVPGLGSRLHHRTGDGLPKLLTRPPHAAGLITQIQIQIQIQDGHRNSSSTGWGTNYIFLALRGLLESFYCAQWTQHRQAVFTLVTRGHFFDVSVKL